MRHEVSKGRLTHTKIDVEEAIVIDVAEVRTHWHEDLIQPYLGGDVRKCAIVKVTIKLESFGGDGKLQITPHHLVDGEAVIAGHKEVWPSVVIKVEEPDREAQERGLNARLAGDVGKREVAIVVVKEMGSPVVRYVKVRVAVPVIIGGDNSFGEGYFVDACGVRYVFEGSIAFVTKELAGRVFVPDKEVEEAVVVDVGPGGGLGGGKLSAGEPSLLRHVGEGSVAVVA